MAVYPPPLVPSPIFNSALFTSSTTSITSSGTTPSGPYVDFPNPQGPITFLSGTGDETTIGSNEISVFQNVGISADGVAFNAIGIEYTPPSEAPVSITWDNLATKVEAIGAITGATDATTLNINNTISIQNGETIDNPTQYIEISSDATGNRIALDGAYGTAGQVLTSGGSAGSLSWEDAGGGWNGTAESDLNMDIYAITSNAGTLNLTATDIDITGQATFNSPPHVPEPILGNDAASKGYVDSLVGQYSGGFNLFLNYSQTSGAFPTYKVLSQTISSASQQIVDITGFTSGTQEVARFITEPLGITELPAGLFDAFVYGSVSGTGGDVHYSFQLNKVTSAGVSTPIVTSGISPDVNASPNNNPTSYSMIAPITAPVVFDLTDRVAFILSVTKTGINTITLQTYFEGSYYSFVQSTLNAGTTLLSSNNTWTGTNNFALNPTTPTKLSPANTDIINYADIQRLSTPIVSTLDYYIITTSLYFQYPPAPPTSALITTYQYYGWYFINSVALRKIDWYFAPDYAMTVADVRGLYMNYLNITTTNNDNCPFISIYTKPTGVNDYAPGFYHSVNTFVPTFTPIAATPYCSFMNISGTQQDPFPYGHILGAMAQSTVNNPRGEYLPTEEVLAVTVGTNSISPVNQVNFIMSKVGICLEQGNQELILNPQNINEQPTLSTVLALGSAAGNQSITGVNNLAATSITTPTLSNGVSALTVGTAGQTTDLVGNVRVNGSSGTSGYVLTSTGASTAPTWQASGGGSSWVGTATSNLNMANFNITACPNIDSATSLTLGGGVSTSVSVGKLSQTTDLVGNVQVNGTSGTSGQVLTSTGASTAPTFQALPTPYISASGVASGTIDMNTNSISNGGTISATTLSSTSTTASSLNAASGALTIGTSTGTSTTIGKSAQTTNLQGNVQINGSSGTSGQVLTSTGASTAPTFQALPTPYISASGVASGSISMNANAITVCPSIDSASSLALGTLTGTSTFIGKSAQITNLAGNITINGAAGTSGQVLTSAGSGSPPTWATPSATITALQGTRVFSGAGNSPISNTFSFQRTTITADAVGQKYMFIVNVSILDGTTTTQSCFMSLGYIDGNTNVTSSGFNITNNVVLTTPIVDSTCLASVKSTSTTSMNNTITFTYIYTWAGALTKSFAFITSGGNTFITNYGSISYVKLG